MEGERTETRLKMTREQARAQAKERRPVEGIDGDDLADDERDDDERDDDMVVGWR